MWMCVQLIYGSTAKVDYSSAADGRAFSLTLAGQTEVACLFNSVAGCCFEFIKNFYFTHTERQVYLTLI